MAIYRLEAKIVSRGKQGHSVVAASAYRTGRKLRDERTGRTHNYLARTKGVVNTTILSPNEAIPWTKSSLELWNKVEASEKRVDAQLAREFVLAVPRELTADQQFQTAVGWAQKELVAPGMVVELSLHHPRDGANPHIHLLCTMRKLEGEAFSPLKSREWNSKAQLHQWRKTWCDAENAALEAAGRPERVDHRSLKDRGIDRIPSPKISREAMALKKRGIEPDPVQFQMVREVKMLNEVRPFMRAILRDGEVTMLDASNSHPGWWERSVSFLSNLGAKTKEAVSRAWAKLLDAGTGKGQSNGPGHGSAMNIPENVKRQAKDAVAHKDTTAFIQAFGAKDQAANFTHSQDYLTYAEQPSLQGKPIPDSAKREAKDAIGHPDTKSQIKLMQDTGDVTAPITPSRGTDRIATKIAQAHIASQQLDKIHKHMTQDGFGREL